VFNCRNWKANFAFVVFVLSWAAYPLHAQLTRGFTSGIVTDGTDGVLAGVEVTLTNSATNISRGMLTDDAGFYRFVAIEPGDYSLVFQLPGFETRKVDNIAVKTAQEVVVNQVLAVAPADVFVNVIGTPGGELLKTTPTVERTFTDRVVAELPMQIHNGVRDISRLALLAPNVSRASSFTEFSANGQRSRNNNFILDGVDNNDQSVALNALRIIPEAVEEVQVQTASYSAEFGRSSGAQLSAITKSGTNGYHGGVWDYYRGNWMEPVSLPNKRAGLRETPRFVLNQFGGDMGGPILKDRTFFFGLIEWNRRREAPSAGNATPTTIPTPPGYAALLNMPLGGNVTPAGRQAALSALSFLPSVHAEVANYDNVQTAIVNGVPVELGTARVPLAKPWNFFYSAGRIDHRLTGRDDLTYRYHVDRSYQPNSTNNTQFGTRFASLQIINRQNHSVGYTRIFESHFLNEARLAYTRGGLNFPENDPDTATVSISGLFSIGGLSSFPQARREHLYQLQDVATYIAGRHSLKFGMDLRQNRLAINIGTHTRGTWMFTSLEDFLNNNASRLEQSINEATFDARQWNHAYFFQDDVKATKDFSVNAGVRYEYSTAPHGYFGATDAAVRAIGVPGAARADKNNWAPRLGFVYSPSSPRGLFESLFGQGKTSIRGGFGIAYDVLFYNILASAATNYPRGLMSTTNGPGPQLANLFPALAPKVQLLNPATATFTNTPEDIENPTTNFWNLSIQRELGTTHVLEAGYTGNRSYHQIRQRDVNPGMLTAEQAATVIATGNGNNVSVRRLNPAWGPRNRIETAAKGEYHAGYLKFDRRMSRGLLLGASYTWSATFSDNDEAMAGNDILASSPPVPQDSFNYRAEWSRSAFDRPHRFVVHYVYEIPWFRSPGAGILAKVLGGWQVSGVTEFQSGQPFTIRTGMDTAGTFGAASARPNYNPAGILIKDPVTNDLRTFTIPPDNTGLVVVPRASNGSILQNSMPGGGNLGRNTFRGPSFQNWNISVMKKVTITEDVNVQFRSDLVNVWNHNNFQNPVSVMVRNLGQNLAPLLTDTRQILLSARVRF
jgi:outer membrane receptor protein involved in Fe transport